MRTEKRLYYLIIALSCLIALVITACGSSGGGGGGGTSLQNGLDRLSQNIPGDHTDVDTAYNSSGEGIAVWVAYSQYSTGRLLYAMYNGTDWSTPASLGQTDSAPSVATNGTGFMVVWQKNSNISSKMYNGTGWEPETAVESTPSHAQGPAVASNGSGYASIWRQLYTDPVIGNTTSRLFSNFHNGSGWGDPSSPILAEDLGNGLGIYGYPLTLISNGTNYAAAWRNEDVNFSNIYVTLSNSSGWEPEVLLSNSTVDSSGQVGASNGTGYAVAWTDPDGSVNNIYSAVHNGTGWEPVELIENQPYSSYTDDMTSNGTGYAVTWRHMTSVNVPDVYATIYNGTAWETENAVENVLSYARISSVSTDGVDYAVTWSMQGGSTYNTYASLYTGGAWGDPSSPALIENGTGNVSSDKGSMAWDGTGYAAFWVQDNGTGDSIFYNRYNGSAWGAEVDLATGDFYSNAIQPVAVTNSSGSTMTVWVQYEGESRYLYSRLFNGTAWEAAGRIAGSINAYEPVIATNGNNFMLAYSGTGLFARLYNGSAWEPATSLESISTPSSRPVIASLGDKYAAVWSQYDYGIPGWDIYANVYNGTAWEDPGTVTPLETSATRGWYAEVASNANSVMAVWTQDDGAQDSVYYAHYNGSAWEPAGLVEGLSGNSSQPGIATDGSGYAATWNNSNGAYAAVYNGTGWDASIRVDSNSGAAARPEIASSGTEYAVTWRRGNGIYASLYNGSGWDAEVPVNSVTNSVGYPDIASDGGGYAVVWREYNSGTSAYDLYMNEYNGSWGTAAAVNLSYATGLTADPSIVYSGGKYASIWTQSSADDSFVDSIWGYIGF